MKTARDDAHIFVAAKGYMRRGCSGPVEPCVGENPSVVHCVGSSRASRGGRRERAQRRFNHPWLSDRSNRECAEELLFSGQYSRELGAGHE